MIKFSNTTAVTSVGVFRFPIYSRDQINNGYHLGDIDRDGRLDIVFGGWAYGSDPIGPDNAPTRLLVLKQDSKGQMKSWSGLSGTVIAGTWQPLISDFNGDGHGDIGVAGFADIPVTPVQSTFLLSSGGSWQRVDYADRIAAHSANLADINGDGLKDIVTASYGAYDTVANKPRSADQYFVAQWGGNPVAVWNTPSAEPWHRSPGGSAVAAGDLNNDGHVDYIVGDAVDTSIPLFDENGYFQRSDILVLKGNDDGMPATKAAKITPYFETNHAGLFPINFGDGLKFQETYSHDVRTHIADFDGDGLKDFVLLSTNYALGENASSVRVYKNLGDFQFADMTASWLPGYNTKWLSDYSFQVKDFDRNGTIDLAFAMGGSKARQGNAMFLNDGSGKMHLALHNEFVSLTSAFKKAAKKYYIDDIPRFVAFQTKDGRTSFEVIKDNIFLKDGSRASVYGTLHTNIDFHQQFTSNVKVYGDGDNDRLYGWAGKDTISGAAGDDTLQGGLGNDYLRGGEGRDSFVFNAKLDKDKNVDRIVDFVAVDDTIHLENRYLTKVGSKGTLKSSYFWTGKKAHDSSDRIIYDKKSGTLYYDPDGTGSKAQTKFAVLTKGLKIGYEDFLVI